LGAVFADPNSNADENCAQKCADTCMPCENLCRDQTIGENQKKCKECQENCQKCLDDCHSGGQLSVDRCNICQTQCNVCRLDCMFGKSCDDCDVQCARCSEFCSFRKKRQPPVSNCQEKCASLCTYGKQEDCDECMTECESGGQNQNQIPLGSCRKCMTYCNLCETSCKNTKNGQVGCEKCEEKCAPCREMCSKAKREAPIRPHPITDPPIDSCMLTRCNLICKGIRRNSQECKDCMKQCAENGGHKNDENDRNSPIDGNGTDDKCIEMCRGTCHRDSQGEACKNCLNNCRNDDSNGGGHVAQTCESCRNECHACIAQNYRRCTGPMHDQIPECNACRQTCLPCRDLCH